MTAAASEIGHSVRRVRPEPHFTHAGDGEESGLRSTAGVGQGSEQVKLLASLTFPEPLYFANVG